MNCKHTLLSPIVFVKIIWKRSLEHERLTIPRKFIRKYGADLPNPVFLMPADGREWKVFWSKNDDDVCFENGWKEFATYYSLSYGYLISFEYQKSPYIKVHIVDKSCLEIDYPLNDTQGEYHTHTNGDFDKQPIKDETCDATKSLRVEQLPSTSALDGTITSTTEPQNPSFRIVLRPSYVNGRSLNIPSKFAKKYLKRQQTDVQLQVMDGRTWTVTYYLGKFYTGWGHFRSSNNLQVGDDCHFELTKGPGLCFKVRFFRPLEGTNFFPSSGDGTGSADLTRTSNVKRKKRGSYKKDTKEYGKGKKPTQRVPIKLMRDHFANKDSVMLQFDNKLWPVQLLRFPGVPTKLSKGWTQFLKESNLHVGDVCVFELINTNDAVLRVHIFGNQCQEIN
ncbi:hypothetical protein RJT34_07530 [Clitoria ternatea]|uniref:TF-B3 domain-containing protein n=1 Tax=Clitoria ternatea TaxID=43366 RepID=A0AAN9PTK4_CLITE